MSEIEIAQPTSAQACGCLRPDPPPVIPGALADSEALEQALRGENGVELDAALVGQRERRGGVVTGVCG